MSVNKEKKYTLEEVVNYDKLMSEAKNQYENNVASNNALANNRSSAAHAEYNELNRNINEINKANGRSNTGYAGDTSIDAYNAYRNSVNTAFSDANSANNELYSYYLSKMAELQQAKDNKEATDRQLTQTDKQLDMQEQQYQDEKETNVLSEVSSMLAKDGAFNTDGTISNETATKTWNYIKRVYGDNIPETVMAYLEKENGFSEWLNAFNKGSDEYRNNHNDDYALVDSILAGGGHENTTVGSDDGDNFKIKLASGTEYRLEGVTDLMLTDTEAQFVNSKLPQTHGSIIKYKGKLFVRTEDGKIMRVVGRNRDGIDKLLNEIG